MDSPEPIYHGRVELNIVTLPIKVVSSTPAGFEQLKKALPKCRIESDHGTWEPK